MGFGELSVDIILEVQKQTNSYMFTQLDDILLKHIDMFTQLATY